MRRDTHAGSWYDDDANTLGNEIDQALSHAVESSVPNLKYIISPHAGYFYALRTAAMSYSMIDPSIINTVFILGPSHYLPLRGCAVDISRSLKTPLGNLKVDIKIVDSLVDEYDFMVLNKRRSEQEHSIEMQLPILKHLFNRSGATHIKVVPILVGYVDHTDLEHIGEALLPYFQREDTLFVISSDFCHFGKRFSFTQTGYEDEGFPLWEAIKKLDLDGVKHILKHDLEAFLKYLKETKNTICGRHAIEILLKLISLAGIKIHSKMLSYTQSGKCANLQDSSVSYCAIAGIHIPMSIEACFNPQN
ncbi:cell motility mediator, putative [Babesia ovis]|uniref:Cell motility mediator, putative n=1 Tax=Babesia ovis TaxID=5869 RepID=A0A9W5TDG9_BABOV|nr:cell motility mediator, putative [Babesia ovis]